VVIVAVRTIWRQKFASLDLDTDDAQWSTSCSVRARTILGLHCQLPPYTEAKLIRCNKGAIIRYHCRSAAAVADLHGA